MQLRASFLLIACWLIQAQAVAATAPVPSAPPVAATSHTLQDYDSGYVLSAYEPALRVEPASLTKMMTAYVIFQELKANHIRLTDKVRVSEKAWRMPGSRMFIEVDKLVSVKDLLKGMIVQSGNDASVALAEHAAGSEEAFVQLMNQYADRLGLRGSHFVNSTGLPDPEHYTTAEDMAKLAIALIRDFPEEYQWHAIKSFTFNGITQPNRNKLLWRDDSIDGLKTGHTDSAGYCLAASAKRDGMRLVSVMMGTESEQARARETERLLNYGFRFYQTRRLYKKFNPLQQVRVWKGEAESVGVGLINDLYVTVPRGHYKNLQASIQLNGQVIAPVTQGEVLGTLTLHLGDKKLLERPVVGLQEVGEGTLWRQLVDHVMLMLE